MPVLAALSPPRTSTHTARGRLPASGPPQRAVASSMLLQQGHSIHSHRFRGPQTRQAHTGRLAFSSCPPYPTGPLLWTRALLRSAGSDLRPSVFGLNSSWATFCRRSKAILCNQDQATAASGGAAKDGRLGVVVGRDTHFVAAAYSATRSSHSLTNKPKTSSCSNSKKCPARSSTANVPLG